ncbi:MAG: hypothetical protein L6R38_009204 [Xanthoria sp. 2 TBL-2021]|nr:MAG: hypothetical protein L6R38_009204 [Xanthoria sp. 2 TBL-2021]
MHFTTPLVLSSLFSLSLALPQFEGLKEARPGRLMVSYNAQTFKTFGMKAGAGAIAAEVKDSQPFTIKAYNSEFPEIHMKDIVASNTQFFIGKKTGCLCPEEVKDCPVGNVTALQVTKEGNAVLDVQVKEPQPIYIGPRAQLRFNRPGVKVREDLKQTTFTLQPNPIPAPPGSAAFVFSGVGRATGYLACPVRGREPIYQVFAGLPSIKDSWVPGGDVSNCIGFDAFATNYTSPMPAAYQYV